MCVCVVLVHYIIRTFRTSVLNLRGMVCTRPLVVKVIVVAVVSDTSSRGRRARPEAEWPPNAVWTASIRDAILILILIFILSPLPWRQELRRSCRCAASRLCCFRMRNSWRERFNIYLPIRNLAENLTSILPQSWRITWKSLRLSQYRSRRG